MLLTIPDVLTAAEVAEVRQILDSAEWVDGKITAGYQAQSVKENVQLPEGHPAAAKAGEIVLAALARSSLFMSAALPLKVFSPMFNRYTGAAISALTWIPLSAPWLRRVSVSVPMYPLPCFLLRPITTKAASSSLKTPTACIASSCPPDIWSFIRRPACIG